MINEWGGDALTGFDMNSFLHKVHLCVCVCVSIMVYFFIFYDKIYDVGTRQILTYIISMMFPFDCWNVKN